MPSDRLPDWGVARSFSALATDVLDATVFVVASVLAVLLSSAVWLALAALLAAVSPIPGGIAPETLATVVWLAIVVVGPAVAVARVLRGPIHERLTTRPTVALLPPLLLLGAVATVVAEVGAGRLAVLALVAAAFVLVRRVVHLYAQHVRTRPLSRRGRFRLAIGALVPLSYLLVDVTTDLLAGVVPLGETGSAWLGDVLVAAGVPAQVTAGEAAVDAHVLAGLTWPLVLCGGYVLFQTASALRRRLEGQHQGPPPTVDRVATGWTAVPANGSIVHWLRSAIGGASPATHGEVTLPKSKSEWKYDDPEAERAHRRAQQRDPAEAVEIGEVVPLVLEEADYTGNSPTIMGTVNALKVFVDDVPDDLSRHETICVKVTGYGGKRTSADAVFLSRGRCSKRDRGT